MNALWPWFTLILLGAYHGLNPAMGWLFAVALGLQERNRSAVLRAFAPIALGHALSVGAVIAVVVIAQAFVTPELIRQIGVVVLIGYGSVMLFRGAAHPRWVAMQVGFRDLTLWSFLMSSAHGAGLMLLPMLLRFGSEATVYAQATHDHAAHATHANHLQVVNTAAVPFAEIGAVAVHTAAMFVVMGLIALIVYEYVGLAILRRAWFNLDRVWAGTLIMAGVLSIGFI